ncbi:phage baseplate assembly protein V [Alkalilimnicola sp. S0819]|uniref:phage baseplate assembly protein V n=1 Tax=Alkalilimnicola sp. S0819 TaxID=2613922 RepID=UPI00126227DB|nr:phage baseplate assembly protein V [Alkalilimnicola sp. S0819]KAB7624315.1 phage baseplate assembly protein V [Alkalilimnicola sp. S0819]MPQ16139.1 phage baseplate assembly protein V [Alkalilimnicola sp. S0819]
MTDLVRLFSKLMRPLAKRLRNMTGRGVLLTTDDGRKVQEVQIRGLSGEILDRVQHVQPYGFTAHAHPGAEQFFFCVGGDRSHAIVLVSEDGRYRKKNLAAGEVALYTSEGDYLHFKRGRLVEVVAGAEVDVTAPLVQVHASTKVVLDTPLTHCTGRIEAEGDITDNVGSNSRSMAGMRQVYDSHTHPENDNGGPTSTPNQKMGDA